MKLTRKQFEIVYLAIEEAQIKTPLGEMWDVEKVLSISINIKNNKQ